MFREVYIKYVMRRVLAAVFLQNAQGETVNVLPKCF